METRSFRGEPRFVSLDAVPGLDELENEATFPRRKKKRSSAARRVSFAETKTIRVYNEYKTPPGATPDQAVRRSPRLAEKRKLSQLQVKCPEVMVAEGCSSERCATSSAEMTGPVDMDHVNSAADVSSFPDDDITLDSTTFSARLSAFGGEADCFKFQVPHNDENDKSPWTSDMSFTNQRIHREHIPLAISPLASVDKCVTMQYTEVIDAGTLAQRQKRDFWDSPCRSQIMTPKTLTFGSDKSPFRKPLKDITSTFQNRLTEVSEAEAQVHKRAILLCVAEAFGSCYRSLCELVSHCSALELSIPQSVPLPSEELLRHKLDEAPALREENKEGDQKVANLKNKLESLKSKIQEHSLSAGSERMKTCFLQSIQGWHAIKISRKENLNMLQSSYSCGMNQSIIIEEGGSAWVQLSPNIEFIEKAFPRTNVASLFEGRFPEEKFRLKQLPAVLETTSSVLMNLAQIAQEAEECRVEYPCLQSVVFCKDSDFGTPAMLFSYANYRLRAKASLVFLLDGLNSGEYPKDITPVEVNVELENSRQKIITEEELRKAISSVPPGYRRFHRLCVCISSFFC